MKKIFSVISAFAILIFVFVSESYPMAHSKLPGLGGGGGGGSKVNIGDAKLKFTKLFAQSLSDYAKAQEALFLAYGKKDLAARAAQVASFNTDAKKSENNIAKSVEIITNNNTEAEALLNGANVKFSAEAAAHYAKALPPTVTGTLSAVQMPPEAKNLMDVIQSDKMALMKMGELVKVLPKIPDLVKSMTTVGGLLIKVAKNNNIKGAADAEKKFKF
jgi:hypothetical protein